MLIVARACIFSMLGIHFRKIQAETAERAWNFTAVNVVTYVLKA